jgi:cyclase
MQKVTENVYVEIEFPGCNSSFVVTSGGTVIIDTPVVPSDAKKWREEAGKHGEIRYVIVNEPHNDHIAGSCWLGGTLVAHQGTREAIKTYPKEALEGVIKFMGPEGTILDEGLQYRLPDITFSQEMTLYLGDHTFRIIPVPGHTASQTAVFVPEERVIFTSDNITMGMPVMIDAVPELWLESIKKLQTLDFDKIVPGHGDVCDKTALDVTYDNVEYIIKEVKAAIAKGWSLQEVQEKVTLDDRFPASPDDPMKKMRHDSLAGLYRTLTK